MAKMDFVKFTPGTERDLNDETLAEDCLQEVMLKLAKNPLNIGEYGSTQTKHIS